MECKPITVKLMNEFRHFNPSYKLYTVFISFREKQYNKRQLKLLIELLAYKRSRMTFNYWSEKLFSSLPLMKFSMILLNQLFAK